MRLANSNTPLQPNVASVDSKGEVESARDRKSWVFAAALATIFMAAIEATIVAAAMPSIVAVLGGLDHFSWVFSAYLLTQAVSIPIYGRLADVYGRKQILLFGIGVFLLGSLSAGFAWDMISLITFRILQGAGAGALVPVAQTIVGDLYSGEHRARMQGYVSSIFGSAAILGPTIGSILVAYSSWRLVFWINIPLGLLAGLMLILALKEPKQIKPHSIDYIGSVLMMLGTATLMFTLVQAPSLDGSTIAGLLAASALLLGAFLFYERRIQEPMLPLKIYRNRIIAGGNVVCLANGAIMMSIAAFLPAYMQGVLRSGPFLAGLALAAMSFAWPIGGFVGSRLMLWFSYRIAAVIGGVLLIAGSLMMIALKPSLGPAWPIGGAMFLGFGMGVTNICFVVAVQGAVDRSQRGSATSSLAFSRIIGQSLGAAVFGGILNFGLSGHGTDVVVRMIEPRLHHDVDPAAIETVREAFAASMHNVYLIAALLALAVFAAVQFLPSGLKLIEQDRSR